tara:strand:+ start:5027 stop:5332 length:306 start_codon:yes stop_codon:yes gene_type:complete
MSQPKAARASKKYDLIVTRGVRVANAETGMLELVTPLGSDGQPKVGGKPIRISVTRRDGNQIVAAGRGHWAEGKPPREAASVQPTETAAKAPARSRGAAAK